MRTATTLTNAAELKNIFRAIASPVKPTLNWQLVEKYGLNWQRVEKYALNWQRVENAPYNNRRLKRTETRTEPQNLK